jgi:hypothetical protein
VETSSDLIRLPVQFLTSSYPLEEITVHDEDEPFLPSIETCLHSPIANIQNIEKATSTAAALNQPTEKTVDNLSERTDPLTPPEPPRDEKSAISPDSIPRKLAEILPNLPTFRRVEEFPLSASSSKRQSSPFFSQKNQSISPKSRHSADRFPGLNPVSLPIRTASSAPTTHQMAWISFH